MLLALLATATVYAYPASVVSVIDGDTVKVNVAGWPEPFNPINVRVYGIDAPEHAKPPAKAACEVVLGVKAQTFARSLLKPGDLVTVTWQRGWRDKYDRLLATIKTPTGADFGQTMLSSGNARAYSGGRKQPWC